MRRSIGFAILAAVLVLTAHALLVRQPPPAVASQERRPTGELTRLDDASPVPVVAREDSAPQAAAGGVGSAPAAGAAERDPVGVIQPVAEHVNPQTESVVDAERTGDHPERLSALIAPKAFDHDAFVRDPTAYLDVVEPARVYQSATPADGVPALRPVGTTAFRMRQDESVVVRVQTQPGYPVTFTSFDMGRFDNQLATETVPADDRGIAAARFSAGPGTIAGVRILAGSPGASGQVRFFVDVQPSVASADVPPAADRTSAP